MRKIDILKTLLTNYLKNHHKIIILKKKESESLRKKFTKYKKENSNASFLKIKYRK